MGSRLVWPHFYQTLSHILPGLPLDPKLITHKFCVLKTPLNGPSRGGYLDVIKYLILKGVKTFKIEDVSRWKVRCIVYI